MQCGRPLALGPHHCEALLPETGLAARLVCVHTFTSAGAGRGSLVPKPH